MPPGSIMTPMSRYDIANNPDLIENLRQSPAGRIDSAMDIAQAVHFLASEDAGFISGCDHLVDGGLMGAMQAARERKDTTARDETGRDKGEN